MPAPASNLRLVVRRQLPEPSLALAWLALCLAWAAGGSAFGPIRPLALLLISTRSDSPAVVCFWIALLASVGAAFRLLFLWSARKDSKIGLPARLLALLLAFGLCSATYGALWFVVPHLPRPGFGYGAYYTLPDMPKEGFVTLLLALAFALAPAGLLRALSARPARAVLLGGVLLLTTGIWGLTPGLGWRSTYEPGWGRLVLLGVALGGAYALAGHLLWSSPSAQPKPTRRFLPTLLALGLGAPSMLAICDYKPLLLPQMRLLDEFIHASPLHDFVHLHFGSSGVLGVWALFVAHLAKRWGQGPGPLGDPLLCSATGLHLTSGVVLLFPAALTNYVATERLLVSPQVALIGAAWLAFTLPLWWLRLRHAKEQARAAHASWPTRPRESARRSSL